MKPTVLFLSCEHAVSDVPPAYRYLFKHNEAILQSHRAIDFGALSVAKSLSQALGCECVTATVTRLLIDCNRTVTHPDCFSELTTKLPEQEKLHLIDTFYRPYREQCEAKIQALIETGAQVLHVSVHSFTPEFKGVIRNAAIGLLYDPKRHGEKEVARQWHGLLFHELPAYRIRMNYPYRGNSDGFTSALRKRYSEKEYLGMELEINQSLLKDQDKASIDEVSDFLARTLKALLLLL